jgi:NhaP-type Na+/H+ or K+/H+ antiporter
MYGLVLVLAALISGVASRTPLSTSLMVLVLGVVLGPGVLGVVDVSAEDAIVSALAEVALVTVLFTDGQRLPLREFDGPPLLPVVRCWWASR